MRSLTMGGTVGCLKCALFAVRKLTGPVDAAYLGSFSSISDVTWYKKLKKYRNTILKVFKTDVRIVFGDLLLIDQHNAATSICLGNLVLYDYKAFFTIDVFNCTCRRIVRGGYCNRDFDGLLRSAYSAALFFCTVSSLRSASGAHPTCQRDFCGAAVPSQ